LSDEENRFAVLIGTTKLPSSKTPKTIFLINHKSSYQTTVQKPLFTKNDVPDDSRVSQFNLRSCAVAGKGV
jgi:hypothetical protein